jgi:hypothetical protein
LVVGFSPSVVPTFLFPFFFFFWSPFQFTPFSGCFPCTWSFFPLLDFHQVAQSRLFPSNGYNNKQPTLPFVTMAEGPMSLYPPPLVARNGASSSTLSRSAWAGATKCLESNQQQSTCCPMFSIHENQKKKKNQPKGHKCCLLLLPFFLLYWLVHTNTSWERKKGGRRFRRVWSG